jgi:hypothetical protein
MHVEECSHGFCEGAIPVFLWKGLRKTLKTLRIIGVPTGIRTGKYKGKIILVLNLIKHHAVKEYVEVEL